MGNKQRYFLSFLSLVTLLVIGSTSAFGNVITVSTNTVNFGSLQQGQPRTQTVIVTNTGNETLRFAVRATAPFTVQPTAGEAGTGSQIRVAVTTPVAAPAGSHQGKLTITAFQGLSQVESVELSLSVRILPSPDLFISDIALVRQTASTNGNRIVRIRLTLQSAGGDNITASTRTFGKVGSFSENEDYTNVSDTYTAAGFQKEFDVTLTGQTQPISFTVRAQADFDFKVPESNESNNQKIVTLTLPPIQ